MLTAHLLILLSVLAGALAAPQGCHGRGCEDRTSVGSSVADSDSTPEPTGASNAEGVWSNSTGVPEDQGPDATVTNNLAESTSAKSSAASSTPAARSSSSSAGGDDRWKPSMSDTIVVDLENKPIPSNEATVYVVDLAHTAEQIQAYHDDDKKVVCYFSAGAWDPYRDDKTDFLPQCYCGTGDASADADGNCLNEENKQPDWSAWWFDLMTPECVDNVKEVLEKRIVAAKDKGCHGIDPDNVDSFQNEVTYKNTAAAQLSFNLWLAETAHANGLAIDLKNAGMLLQESEDYKTQLVDAFDFNVIESCHTYDACNYYDVFLDAGKPQIQLEYTEVEGSATACDPPREGVGMLLYPTRLVNSADITLTCYA